MYTCGRDEQQLSQTVANLSGQGHAVGGCRADVTKYDDAKDLVAKATEFFDGMMQQGLTSDESEIDSQNKQQMTCLRFVPILAELCRGRAATAPHP